SNIISLTAFNPVTDYVVEAKATYAASLPVDMDYNPSPPSILTQMVYFELYDISGGSPGVPIVVTNCCGNDEETSPPPLPNYETQRVMTCGNPCLDPIEVDQYCSVVELRLPYSNYCGYLGDLEYYPYNFIVDYDDGPPINYGSLANALTHTYTTFGTYTITVQLYNPNPGIICINGQEEQ